MIDYGSFHMELPFLLAGVYVGKGQQLGENGQAVLNEAFRCLADVRLHFFGDFVEVIELVPDHSNEIADGLEVVLAVEVHF